jgi:branched-chain amino acid transport system substrate-binding protein
VSRTPRAAGTSRRLRRGIAVAVVLLVVAAAGTTPAAPATAPTTTLPGVARTTVTVGGLVPDGPDGQQADLGARARFERANRAGRVHGRTIEYRGSVPVSDAVAVDTLARESFAVVPAIGLTDAATTLGRAGVPFVGSASSAEWQGSTHGFGITGSAVSELGAQPNPAWGDQLTALLGTAAGKTVAVVTDDPRAASPPSTRRVPRPAALEDAGFTVAPTIVVAPAAPPEEIQATAASLLAQNPAVVLVLAASETVVGLRQELATLGFTGTVATQDILYQPAFPSVGAGLTILVTIAPTESGTAAIRRLTDDVRALDPAIVITPAVAEGYFAADFFLRVLARAGRDLTAKRFLAVANGGRFTYAVPRTIGRSSWPAMHTRPIPCGALVQGDGTEYVVAEPYRCSRTVRR